MMTKIKHIAMLWLLYGTVFATGMLVFFKEPPKKDIPAPVVYTRTETEYQDLRNKLLGARTRIRELELYINESKLGVK